jgi:hypothetical protein
MATTRFEFSYDTPTQGVDGQGNPVTIAVPTTFALGGVSDDVAKGIRAGLRKVTSITNVVVERVSETKESMAPDPPA